MSELFQTGQHPDADQLSAFAEHALPVHERESVMGHLAVCGECREVVSLMLPPLEELPAVQPAVRRPWYSGWRLAWPIAVACAAVVMLVVQMRRGGDRAGGVSPTVQMAAAGVPDQPMGAGTVPSRPETAQAAKPVVMDSPSKPEAKSNGVAALPLEGRNVQASQSVSPAPPRAAPTQERVGAGNAIGSVAGQPPSGGLGPQQPISGSTAAELAVQPAANASSVVISSGAAQPLRAAQGAPARPATAPLALQAVPPPPARDAAAATTVINGASLDALADDAGTLPGYTLAKKANGTLAAARNSIRHPLPSGLPALAVANSGQTALALDTANALFYSADGGLHWKPVRAKWAGRAVDVALAVPPAVAVALPVAAPKPASQDQALQRSAASAAAPVVLQSRKASGATLSGQVTDSSGAVVANATVTIVGSSPSASVTVKTDNAGRYFAGGLAPGAYRIDFSSPGFIRQEQTITLAESQTLQADAKLQVGAVAETVEVTSAAPPIETEDNSSRVAGMLKAKSKSSVLPVFAITTDSGQRWVSADGKSWRRE